MPITDSTTEEPRTSPNKKKKGKGRAFFILLTVVIVVVIIGVLISRYTGEGAISIGGKGDYQAVFLINGQVYFGHVVKETETAIVLRDIYYLRANQTSENLQQGEGAAVASDLSLIKLGNELHGPKDEMRIVRNNVLFIENLKPDSKVTTAIEEYIASQED